MTEEGEKKTGAAVPAWKLRMSMNQNQKQSKAALDVKAKLKKKMDQAVLDPNLPAAFKVANKDRMAFVKQQARRKNNDTFVSLNSSHPAPKEPVVTAHDDDSDDSSLGSDSFGE
mmetsp:Transcript_52280/g.150570  ORF Transcript_52280/g.150570 Transcript_52280/m.150570 type:complete len:114 (+) Transcript_52280:174-515(+)